MRTYHSVIVLLCLMLSFPAQAQNTEVVVLPSIHAFHRSNPNYTYKDLFGIIRAFDPDVIAVEIRKEDIGQAREYLDTFYPDEMIMVRDSFPSTTCGIDYYGAEVEGKLIPKNIFKDTLSDLGKYVQLQQKMQNDSLIQREERRLGMPEILEKQLELAKKYSALQLMNGEYDELTAKYYNLMDSLLLDSPYQEYVEFNNLRDQKITANAINLISQNPEKRVLIIVGANHRGRLMKALKTIDSVKVISGSQLQGLL